jgi:hypothetical protein
MSSTLKLSCWLVGDDAAQVFPVKIANTESVGNLKEVIKDTTKIEMGRERQLVTRDA